MSKRVDIYHHYPCENCGGFHEDDVSILNCLVLTIQTGDVLLAKLFKPAPKSNVGDNNGKGN